MGSTIADIGGGGASRIIGKGSRTSQQGSQQNEAEKMHDKFVPSVGNKTARNAAGFMFRVSLNDWLTDWQSPVAAGLRFIFGSGSPPHSCRKLATPIGEKRYPFETRNV
ncbi:MAG TPA: hypothetical protein VLV55_14160 [Rhizomicrobium sp.]|nr:hypothetical protein [Rhizomicrobium sp.]